jgi:2-C-methyl-D-erythritol 2,4-cyclodiphosphate synthase
MITNIADALNIGEDRVNIKATTEEGLGFTGKGLGIASQAVALIEDSMSI